MRCGLMFVSYICFLYLFLMFYAIPLPEACPLQAKRQEFLIPVCDVGLNKNKDIWENLKLCVMERRLLCQTKIALMTFF